MGPANPAYVQCSRCRWEGHLAKDCMNKNFMRTETIAEERERKRKEQQKKQAELEDRQRIRQEKQAEWEDRQRTIAEERERNSQEQQKKLVEWEDRQKKGQEKERKAKKEHDDQASTRTSSPCPTGHGDSTVHKIPMKK